MHHTVLITFIIGFFGLALLPATVPAQPLDACDWEAAHPSDPDRVGPGRPSGEVDVQRAIAACRQAVEAHPDTARFHYQLARALVYRADRGEGDWHVGLPPLERAAELRHVQAMFVLGLMRQRTGDWCAAEPWTRAAAEAGLKSARISYVNDTLAGRFADCGTVADATTRAGWLQAARGQVSGWYENMLLDALIRESDLNGAGETSP